MKPKNFLIFQFQLIAVLLVLETACKKDDDNANNGNNTSNTFTDTRDGNTYKVVAIGNQVWMAENLKYLPNVVGPGTGSTTTPYYYVYGYGGTNINNAKTTANYQTYGVLYNWPAAMQACPIGWHLPSDSEWTKLTDYLGGASVAGSKLKEIGTSHWNSPNGGATNETGFTALPGGRRTAEWGDFQDIGYHGHWWSAFEVNTQLALSKLMQFDYCGVYSGNNYKKFGYSVRCVRD